MFFNLYTFEYSTKTRKCKRISYSASGFPSALLRFTRNTRYTKLFRVFKNGILNKALY